VLSINETASGVTLTIKVQPRARKNALLGELGGVLKIAVIARTTPASLCWRQH
jgi:uncharacterized protein YggU (UPF0235/DUF167 family)